MHDRLLKQHERRAELFDETAAPTPASAAVAPPDPKWKRVRGLF
jgi:hypothetical protein